MAWSTLKVSNVSYFPLAGGVPAWRLNYAGNVWDALIDAIATTFDDINGNGKNYSNLGNVALAAGKGLTIGTVFSGTAHSATLVSNAGSLPTTVTSEIAVASFGFAAGNDMSLGVRAYRFSAGSFYTTAAIGLSVDVDNSARLAAVWLNPSGFVGIGAGMFNPAYSLHTSGAFGVNSVSAPGTPAAGSFVVYMDSADNKLKCKGPSGTVTTLGNP